MKGSSKYKKPLIITGIALGTMLLLSLAAMKFCKNVLRKHHISYQSLDFNFPSSQSVRDLRMASSEAFNLEVALLEVEWSSGSLFRGAPK